MAEGFAGGGEAFGSTSGGGGSGMSVESVTPTAIEQAFHISTGSSFGALPEFPFNGSRTRFPLLRDAQLAALGFGIVVLLLSAAWVLRK